MRTIRPLVVALAASTILTSAAFAKQAENAPVADAAMPSAATQTANKAFSKLSADGLKAFREVRLARLAIFNAQTDQAKKYADEARTLIAKAKVDDTAYMKDEASLKRPAGVNQKTSSDATAPSKTPTAWLPVDGGLTLGEDFVATPAKAASVAKANEQLKKGNNKQAMDTLKLSDINVAFVVDIAPLDKTVSGIDQASQLIDSGKYYEGNEALKGVEDGIRFDVADINSLPSAKANTEKNDSKNSSATTGTSSHASSGSPSPTTPATK